MSFAPVMEISSTQRSSRTAQRGASRFVMRVRSCLGCCDPLVATYYTERLLLTGRDRKRSGDADCGRCLPHSYQAWTGSLGIGLRSRRTNWPIRLCSRECDHFFGRGFFGPGFAVSSSSPLICLIDTSKVIYIGFELLLCIRTSVNCRLITRDGRRLHSAWEALSNRP
jgi:hypothetical protein